MSLFIVTHKIALIGIVWALMVITLAVFNVLVIKYNGAPVAVPTIPRDTQVVGEGKDLTLVIMGDSTGVGQGGAYEKGIAVDSAMFLANKGFRVSYQNVAISGARAATVLEKQAKTAAAVHPDVVLLAMGANDVTHLTRVTEVKRDTRAIIDMLQVANPAVTIIMTGSPEMGSVPRFPQPSKYLAELRTRSINKAFDGIAIEKNVLRARIAEETGPIFKAQPDLFAQDKFHPSEAGYAIWFKTLHETLENTF